MMMINKMHFIIRGFTKANFRAEKNPLQLKEENCG